MKFFHVITRDNTVKNPYVADSWDLGPYDWPDFIQGKAPGQWPEHACLKATNTDQDGDPDDVLLNDAGLLVFSARLRAALAQYGINDLKYYPIAVERPDGSYIPGFTYVEVPFVRALDYEHSDLDLRKRKGKPSEVLRVRKYVLARKAVEGHHIFRLIDDPVALFVSEEFRDTFKQARCTGMGFKVVGVFP